MPQVERDTISITTKAGEKEQLPYGVCVWSTGAPGFPAAALALSRSLLAAFIVLCDPPWHDSPLA